MPTIECFATMKKWKYIMLFGLNLLPNMNAHDNQGVRKGVVPQLARDRQFDTFMQQRKNGRALAIDEFAAIYVAGNEHLEVISFDNSGVQLVKSSTGNVYRERIAESINLSDYF